VSFIRNDVRKNCAETGNVEQQKASIMLAVFKRDVNVL
jgi:hypothetical protein